MNFEGLFAGVCTFAIIGVLHPVVIKTEYYFGIKVWYWFLVSGLICIVLSIYFMSSTVSTVLAIVGFSLLWSIKELFEQKKRVEKGWFPANPRK